MGYMGRDLQVIQLDQDRYLVAACDSCGAVGAKEFDVVKVSPYIVGRFTARVALFEVITTQAKPLMLSVTSANEPGPTSKGILEGVNDELEALNFQGIPIIISTEKTMPTKQTGLGITAIGECQKALLRIATSKPGDTLYCLGLPKFGPEVTTTDDPEIVQAKDIQLLLTSMGVHDIIPVGSSGIRGEAELLAAQVKGRFESEKEVKVNLIKPAGPSTCLIFTCSPGYSPPTFSSTPIFKVGKI